MAKIRYCDGEPHWLQIDFHTPITLRRLGIQGSPVDDCWVTYYNVSYTTLTSMDWIQYQEDGKDKVCDGDLTGCR